jgi:hypothetical protein
MSSASPGTGCPAAVETGSSPRVSVVCAHASSRAVARACRSRPNADPSMLDNTRQAVGSEATGPNSATMWTALMKGRGKAVSQK